jgi:putative ABC transport system permease protein
MTEVALAVILLAGAGLMMQSLARLQAVDPGFQSHSIAAFGVRLSGARYEEFDRMRQFYRDARQRLARIPGVRNAAAISNLPLDGVESFNFYYIEGQPAPAQGADPLAENPKITPGYFDTLGIAVVRGRDFSDRDTPDQPIVCIINEELARRFPAGVDPIGHRLKMGRADENRTWMTIVGVARNVRTRSLDTTPRPQVYTTVEQNTDNEMTMVLAALGAAGPGASAALERPVRGAMRELDPTLPVAEFRTMERLVGQAVARQRFTSFLLGLFAGTALLLTAVGLYGVVAYATSQRTREIGVRLALGASRRDVLALIIGQGLRPALIGLGIGLTGALILTRLLANQLYEVKASDPLTFLGATAVLLLVALAACFFPARSAAGVDPVIALRAD